MSLLEEKAFEEQLKICAQSGSEDYETQIKATALMSIAISLKRIADIMQGKQKPVLITAEQYAEYKRNIEKDGNSRP